jgi:biotin carboxyl carrier protein
VGKIFTVSPGSDDERKIAVDLISEDPPRFSVTLDHGADNARTVELDARKLPSGAYHVMWGSRSLEVDLFDRNDTWTVEVAGQTREFLLLDQRKLAMRSSKGGGAGADGPELHTPMAGKIVKYLVAVGDEVEEGQGVVIVEAMKMENELKAHRAGTVSELGADVGVAVEVGEKLLRIEVEE